MWNPDGTVAMTWGSENSLDSAATAINNSGQVAWVDEVKVYDDRYPGEENFFVPERRAYRWDAVNGSVELASLSGVEPVPGHPRPGDCACAINEAGQIAGSSGYFAVIWNPDGSVIQLSDVDSVAYGINNLGQVVGVCNNRAALWNPDGTMVDLGTFPGCGASTAWSINDFGQIVGSSWGSWGDPSVAVLWQPVPEPSSLLALFGGLAGVGGFAVRRRKK
jgi:probable HAF family extracellular repeat protein